MDRRQHHRLILLIPAVFGFGLALASAGANDLGLDGGLSLAIAQLPLREELDFLAHDVHPPLFYLLLRVWIACVGTTPFAVKALTIASSVLGIVILTGWVRSIAGNRAALIAGALLAVSPVALEMSATVREFALSVPCILLAGWACTSRSRRVGWSIGAAGAVALWTSYFAAALLAAAALDALLHSERRRRIVAMAAAGASLVPWIAFIVARGFLLTAQSDGPRQGEVHSNPFLVQLLDIARIVVAGLQLAPSWLGPGLAAIGLGTLAILALRRQPESAAPLASGAVQILAAGAALTLALAIIVNVSWTREGMGTRYILTAIPFLAALFGIGCARVSRSNFGALAVSAPLVIAGVLGAHAWLQRPAPPPDFWAPGTFISYLDEHVRPNDVVVFVSPEQAGYYTALSRRPERWVLITTSPDYLATDVYGRAEATLQPLTSDQRTLWTVLYRQVLGTRGTVRLIDWLSLYGYDLPSEKLVDSDVAQHVVFRWAEAPTEVSRLFDGGVQLAAVRFRAALKPGDVLPLELDWLTTKRQDRGRTVFVHLVDESNRKWAQNDSIPVNGRSPLTQWTPGQPVVDRYGLALPLDMPPGQYWLSVGLYDDSGRLPLVDGGDTVRLGPLVVGSGSASADSLAAAPAPPVTR